MKKFLALVLALCMMIPFAAFADETVKLGQVDYAAAAQKELSSVLGRKVRIVTGRNKGRVELEYYGIDDLNDLLEALALLQKQRKGTSS